MYCISCGSASPLAKLWSFDRLSSSGETLLSALRYFAPTLYTFCSSALAFASTTIELFSLGAAFDIDNLSLPDSAFDKVPCPGLAGILVERLITEAFNIFNLFNACCRAEAANDETPSTRGANNANSPDGSTRFTGSPTPYAYAFTPPFPNGLKLSGLLNRINTGLNARYPFPSK
ncbi:hypothetical protein D3C81_449280 [compost metagenome]